MTVGSPAGVSWRRRIAVGVTIWFLLCAGALFVRAEIRPALLAIAIAATGATLLLFLDVSTETPSVSWTLRGDAPVVPHGEDPRLALLVRLVNGHLVARDSDNRLRAHLLEITDQRLLAHHGVSRIADPDRASALMAPELAALVAQAPPYPRMTLAHIARLAEQIEEL